MQLIYCNSAREGKRAIQRERESESVREKESES